VASVPLFASTLMTMQQSWSGSPACAGGKVDETTSRAASVARIIQVCMWLLLQRLMSAAYKGRPGPGLGRLLRSVSPASTAGVTRSVL
jgi:hypothetical protein